jgi:hypothetical protein
VLILIFNQVPILVPGDSAIGVDLLGIVADLQLAESALGIDALRCELPLADAAAGAESAAVGQVPGDAAVGSDIAAIDLAFAEAAVGSMLAAVMSGIDLADAAVGVDAIDVPEAAGVPQPTPVAATFLFGSHELSYGGRAAEHNPSRDNEVPLPRSAALQRAALARPETAEVFADAFVQILVGEAHVESMPHVAARRTAPPARGLRIELRGPRFRTSAMW